MNFFDGIYFEFPQFFWILAIYVLLKIIFKEQIQTIYFSNTQMLSKIAKKEHYFVEILKFLILVFMVLALANPIKKDKFSESFGEGHEISLILDASIGMLENEKFNFTKEILQDFIAERKNDWLALSIFADYAYVATPLTYDKKIISAILEHIQVGMAGEFETALYEALYLGSDIFKDSKSKNKVAILITDGINSAESVPLGIAIKRAKKFNIKVYTVGIGKKGDYNSFILKKIALETGGKFFEANQKKDMQKISNQINILEKSEIKTKNYTKTIYFFHIPLYFAASLLFLYIAFFRIKK